MPLPQLTMPEGTPPFFAEGHSFEQRSQYGVVRFQTGHSRSRRLWTAGEKLVATSLRMDEAQAAAFHDWYESALPAANGQFAALVGNEETDEAAALWYRGEFESPPQYEPISGIVWLVTATLRLTGPGQAESPYTGEVGYLARAAISGSARGTVMPTAGYTARAVLLPQIALGYRSTTALQPQIRVSYRSTVALRPLVLAYRATAALLPD